MVFSLDDNLRGVGVSLWPESIVTQKQLDKMVGSNLLPDDISFYPAHDAIVPMPLKEQTVVLLDHFLCGLSYPLSQFML